MVVPGNITNLNSVGCNNLIKAGAHPITSYEDGLHIVGIEAQVAQQQPFGSNEHEQLLLKNGVSDGDELQLKSQLDIALFNQTLTMLEISGKVRSLGANTWTIH